MEALPVWLSRFVEGGGTAALIFAVWWITTKLNERRQDKLLETIEKEREASQRLAKEERESGQKVAKDDRDAFTRSIESVTQSLVDEIHKERERVMTAHEYNTEADRTILKELTGSIQVLVAKFGDQRVDDAKLYEAVKTQTKAIERMEQAVINRGGL